MITEGLRIADIFRLITLVLDSIGSRQVGTISRRRLTAVTYQQDDLITRAQAMDLGISDGTLRHAIGRRGAWQVVAPGIYAVFTGELSEVQRLRAALLYAGPEAVITGPMACRLHGLRYAPATNEIDVLVAMNAKRRSSTVARIHRTVRLPAPRYWMATGPSDENFDVVHRAAFETHDPLAGSATRGHIELAPPARAAMDAVRFEHRAIGPSFGKGIPERYRRRLVQDTRALLCEVVQRRKASVSEVARELDAASSSDTAIARLSMADIVAGCRSAPECELRDLFKVSKILPEPRWNQPLPGHRPVRRSDQLTPDACLEDARLVVEVDSVEWHRIGPRQEQTEKRRARYAELGWLVISVSPHRIRRDPKGVLRDIESTYLATGGRRRKVAVAGGTADVL